MTVTRKTYIIRVAGGKLAAVDVPSTVLALMCRSGRALTGDIGREERHELAGLLEGTALAAALVDGRPLRVDGEDGVWTFREV